MLGAISLSSSSHFALALNAARGPTTAAGYILPRNPMVGIAGCCARGERPCGRRPAEKRNELTSPHICTQAHGNSIVSALSKSPDAIRRITEIGLEK
jgi:hypothetical protein